MSSFYPSSACSNGAFTSGNPMPIGNGQWCGVGQPARNDGGLPPSRILREFANNFDYFRDPGSPFVTRESLEFAANRPMTGNHYHDRMTMLGREVIRNPEMASVLDGITNGGEQDGLISPEDVHQTIGFYDAQSMPNNQGFMQGGPRGMPGNMRQQQMNQQNFAPQPSYMTATSYSGHAPRSESRPYANDTKEEFANKVLARFGALEDPSTPGLITDKSLSSIAGGCHLDGRPASQDEMEIAQEVLSRGDQFKELDQGRSGKLDGAFSRDDLGDSSNKYKKSSDHELIQVIKDNFRSYTAGASDSHVNVNELKEAAGLIPSDRTFSPQAREAAMELLQRPGLLRDLDIGTGFFGRGLEDGRFDIENLNYELKKTK